MRKNNVEPQDITLGVRPDHMIISNEGVKGTRIFRGVKYNITIHNTGSTYKLIVNNKVIEGNIIPYNKNDKVVPVDVYC